MHAARDLEKGDPHQFVLTYLLIWSNSEMSLRPKRRQQNSRKSKTLVKDHFVSVKSSAPIKSNRNTRFKDSTYFRTLIDNSSDAIACIGEDRNLMYVNPSAGHMLGYDAEEFEHGIKNGLLHPEDLARVKEEFNSVFGGLQSEITTQCRVLHRDQSWRCIELHLRNFLSDPNIRAVVVNSRDITEQRHAEHALHESEARYRSLVELSPDAIAIHEDGRFVYVNAAGARLLGAASPEVLIGKPILDILHPDYHEVERKRLHFLSREGGDQTPVQERLVRIDGSSIDVEFVAIPVSFKGRKAVQVVVRDLTEQKHSEKILQHRDAILEAVGYAAEQFLKSGMGQESIQEVLKRLGMIMAVSRSHIGDFHFSPEGRTLLSLRHEWVDVGIGPQIQNPSLQNFDMLAHGIDRWLETMNAGDFICGVVKNMPDRERAFFDEQGVLSIAAVPIFVRNEVWGFISFEDCRTERKWSDAELYAVKFAADILGAAFERQKFEQELRSTEQKYRMLFEESRDGVYISTPDGKFVDINLAGVQILGYRSKEEILAIDINQDLYVDRTQRDTFRRAIEDQGYVKDFEQFIKRADGQKLTILETATALRDSSGNIVMYRGIFRDVTKQKKLEQDMIQIHKMESLGTLAAGIAHDFNNILSIILVYNSLLQRVALDPQKLQQSTGAIHEAVQRGANLVRQILTFARKTEVHFGPIDVNLTLKEVSRMLNETFPKTISLTLDLGEGIPFFNGDATQIHQVLLNLCVNARDAMPGGGGLVLKTEMVSGCMIRNKFPEAHASEYVHISVRDNGVGMDETIRTQIFDPFFTTKEKGKGTGLGLSVVYGAVKNHEGFIQVESELGKGSVFHLYFPISSKNSRLNSPDNGTDVEISGGSETILLVEDEDAIRASIESLFESKGYHVISARDGGMAVDIYRERKNEIHLVVSDLGLPVLSGDQVLFHLKALNPSVKMLIASGYFEPETKVELMNTGAVGFIQKPYTPNEILRRVRRALDLKVNV